MTNIKKLEAVRDLMHTEVRAFEERFKKMHSERIDFGTCGSAVVLIGFGRKRKLKDLAIASGLITERTWDSYGKKMFVVDLPSIGVPTQYIGYYEERARIARRIIEEAIGTEADVLVHTWVD